MFPHIWSIQSFVKSTDFTHTTTANKSCSWLCVAPLTLFCNFRFFWGFDEVHALQRNYNTLRQKLLSQCNGYRKDQLWFEEGWRMVRRNQPDYWVNTWQIVYVQGHSAVCYRQEIVYPLSLDACLVSHMEVNLFTHTLLLKKLVSCQPLFLRSKFTLLEYKLSSKN